METTDLYRIWAPSQSPWSRWAAPALFGQMPSESCPLPARRPELPENLASLNNLNPCVVLIDLPAELSIEVAIVLAQRGFQPVPVINAAFGAPGIIDMPALFKALCAWTPLLQSATLAQNANPAFFFDSRRTAGKPAPGVLDNRWLIFAADLPTGDYLKTQAVQEVILIQEGLGQPAPDLAQVLFAWQSAQIKIQVKRIDNNMPPSSLKILPLGLTKRFWFRVQAFMGIGRSAVAAFGDFLFGALEGSGRSG